MTSLAFKRRDDALVPIDEAGFRFMRRIKQGDIVPVEVKVPRNIKHHNKYWALCGFIAFHSSKLHSAEEASDLIKIRIGHCRIVETRAGIAHLPLSISFASMDQLEFEDFWDRVCRFVLEEFFPHITQPRLEAELAEFVGAGPLVG